MEQKELQQRLIYAIDDVGLKAKQISKITNIKECTLSRFKNGKTMLCLPEQKRLEQYLDNFFMVAL